MSSPHTRSRPVVMGRDLSRFRINTKKWIVWTHDSVGRPLPRLSTGATKYFGARRRRLEKRADYIGGPIWTLYRVTAATYPHAVIWSDIVREPVAVSLSETRCSDAIPLNSCYVTSAPNGETALVIAAVMNSMWTTAFLRLHGDEARGGYRRMNARVANQIPIPLKNRTWPTLVELSRAAHHDQSFNQTELDETVANCLGLSTSTRHTLIRAANRDR